MERLTWAKKCCFRTNIEQVHTTSLMLFDNCKDTQLERWLKHRDDWVPVYFLGNHSFDYVCVLIKTTENFNLQLQSTTEGTLVNDQCMYYCCIWQLSMSYIRCFAYKYLIWKEIIVWDVCTVSLSTSSIVWTYTRSLWRQIRYMCQICRQTCLIVKCAYIYKCTVTFSFPG